MADIKTHLNNIKGALYGKDVRRSIHDGMDAINKEVENTTGRQVDLENTFDQLVINAGNSNAEIVDARVKSDGTSYSKLGDRLDGIDSQLEHIKNNNAYLNVLDYSVDNTGITDASEKIQEVLNKGLNVYIPKGEYRIDKTLILKEGTNLLMHNNAILYNNIHQAQPKGLKGISILSNYDVNYHVNGYNLAGNIRITGGTLVGIKSVLDKEELAKLGDIGQDGISISHAENIIIENTLVKDTFRGHGIEVTGCNNVLIENCVIDGCILTEIDVTRVREAIQIEHSHHGSSPSMQDNTLSKNITIRNCVIKNTNENSSNWGSGIGSHNNENEGVMENIIIENNKIYNCLHAGVMLINYKNSKVINNIILDCPRGIGYYQSRPLANVLIEGNTIENATIGGIFIDENSFGLTINNNRFSNIEGTAISLVKSTNLYINNNKFKDCGYSDGVNGVIQLYGLKDSDLSNNYFYRTNGKDVKRIIFIGGTEQYINHNVTYSNNKCDFICSEEDIYLHSSARTTNSNILFDGEFNISNNSTKNLDKSVYQYNALRIETTFGNAIVPIGDGSIKTVICDVGQGSNAFTAIEFTMTLDSLGKNITMTGCRYMSIGNSSQSTQDLTSGLKINITKIIGI